MTLVLGSDFLYCFVMQLNIQKETQIVFKMYSKCIQNDFKTHFGIRVSSKVLLSAILSLANILN
jgi:hypothetical protein